MDVIHSVAIVHWRLVYNSADAFICTDDIQSPIHVLLYEQNQRHSCTHNCTTTLMPMLAPAALPYRQLSSNNTEPNTSLLHQSSSEERATTTRTTTQPIRGADHPLRVKAIKVKAHVQAMKVHKVVQNITPLEQYPQNICGPYFVHGLR